MDLKLLSDRLAFHPAVNGVSEWVADKKNGRSVYLSGLRASGKNLFFASLFNAVPSKLLVVFEDYETAAYAYNDLNQVLDRDKVAILPSSYKKSFKHGDMDMASEILRTDALNLFASSDTFLVVSSPEGIIERVVQNELFGKKKIFLSVGQSVDTETLVDSLTNFGFEQVDFVYEPGQFSRRGSIIDIFSFSCERPFRIDFFGDEIESIRTFDIEKQLSIDKKSEVSIIPDLNRDKKNKAVSILNFIPEDTIIAFADFDYTVNRLNSIYDDALVAKNKISRTADLMQDLTTGTVFKEQISGFRLIEFGSKSYFKPDNVYSFNCSPQPLFHKNFDVVADTFADYISKGYEVFICSDSVKQTDRIADIFLQRGDNIRFTPVLHTVHEGFIDHDLSVCCFSDHQIFDRFHKFTLRSDVAKAGKAALTLKEINQLQIGDYVVHIDHGVGKFAGLMVTENNGRKQEVIKLLYQNDDVIFVSIHGLHRISKYKGKDGEPPRVSKLGSGAWERLKERTKAKVKDIARDLIALYAARKAEKGFEFSPDSYLQHELEASFLYEDTPDQAKSTADIKHDMESALPMDRLVCGDVGFGKTELAVRAAFKAATDNKQVAVLVPTTVLALQHYKTFSERLKNFPCRVEYLSRAKKAADVKQIKKDLADGKIDILIGTHKIVGKDIVFRDLGLLIIDEEQKFGVSVKEKLKSLKVNVDTLTLTATPIPRTLQFSLMGARDLSILTTPPPNRYPITTELSVFDDGLIREAIVNEMNRNGQVFFINNRVQNIYLIEQKLKALVPDVRVAVAHGQMPSQQLEETIIDFIDYEYDVLIATSVVESGVDIPNVNTIIVNNAHMFGLSDLHQLRGRVGRSNKKAYCYLIAPPLDMLPSDAKRRLKAIETFADLGSGFSIAMQDLDIRGAGNILGAEQSGFITDLGYETYQKILNEALSELREQEFADLFADKKESEIAFVQDCYIESDMELLFPIWYVESQTERIALYRELDNIQSEQALVDFEKRMVDRFGKIPEEGYRLFTMVRMRRLAKQYGVERMSLKRGKLTAFLVQASNTRYYSSPEFGKLLTYCTEQYRTCQIMEKDGKRCFSVSGIDDIDKAYEVFKAIDNTVTPT